MLTSPIRFNWDAANLSHSSKHGVSTQSIEFVLSNDPLIEVDAFPKEIEPRWRGVGQDRDGRFIFVVFTARELNEVRYIRPISARYMHKKEIERYEQSKST